MIMIEQLYETDYIASIAAMSRYVCIEYTYIYTCKKWDRIISQKVTELENKRKTSQRVQNTAKTQSFKS